MSYHKHKKIWSSYQEGVRSAYKNHFKRRLRQRYDIDDITDEEIEAVVASLSAKPRVGVISLGARGSRSVKLVCIRGKEVVVVYSKSLKALVTALPIDCKEWGGIPKQFWAQSCYQTFCKEVGLSGSERD